ncbi:MAG: hypothetical protein A3E85_06000 [Gammaproteobacteria bacterium RIFCSPHIGHO2_12_FULL_45_12]|nr:MAG: hypothetical protein A3E85_06000 [Gammaproteobacteria bacterium RIFCSPHIGHO2_12_FULL_45_12]
MNKKIKNFQFLMPLVMLYITVDLASLVYSYKEISLSFIIMMASSIIFPLTFIISDIVTEVYGYKIAKNMIWCGILCDFVFTILTYLVSLTPSPTANQYNAYYVVLNPLLRAITAQTLGIFIGAFTNIYCMSKWKVILKGKHFWLRSIASSIIGEGFALIISVLIALGGILSIKTIMYVILYAYIYKMVFAVFVSPIGQMIAQLLKEKEGIDVYSYDKELNPFKDLIRAN